MTTIHAQMIGDQALLTGGDLERLLELARQVEPVELCLREDDVPTVGMMRVAEQGGAFAFWEDPGEAIYSPGDGEPL